MSKAFAVPVCTVESLLKFLTFIIYALLTFTTLWPTSANDKLILLLKKKKKKKKKEK